MGDTIKIGQLAIVKIIFLASRGTNYIFTPITMPHHPSPRHPFTEMSSGMIGLTLTYSFSMVDIFQFLIRMTISVENLVSESGITL